VISSCLCCSRHVVLLTREKTRFGLLLQVLYKLDMLVPKV
jgi:hypothetical protein